MLHRCIIAPAWAAWEGSPYLRIYRQLCRSQFDSVDVIRARQWKNLQEMLLHAYTTSRLWRERLDAHGVQPQDIRSFDDYTRLPILTKHDLRLHFHELRSADYLASGVTVKKTSGSTGESVTVVVDEAAQQFKRAAAMRADEWSGWRVGQRVACLWGNPDYLRWGWRGRVRNALLERATYFDTLKMDAAAMHSFAAALQARPPGLIFGHAHSLYLFAQYVQQQGIRVPQPKGIISTAMVLHDWQRRGIEKVFRCAVTNRYGCEEVSLIACECEYHNGLHVNADGVYVEIVRADGTAAEPGERGSIVVTDLQNRAMPLLRYKVGDTATATLRQCPCGRGLPLVESIDGREADYVTTATGELVSGISLTENFAMQVPGIGQLQIVQRDVEEFVLRIVRTEEFTAQSDSQIADLVRKRFGASTRYTIEFVEQIPQEPSGKYRFCISHVPNPWQGVPCP